MNPDPESHAWELLRDRAAAQIRPGFADRVLRAARESVEPFSSLFAQLLVGAAAAAACALVVIVVHRQTTAAEDGRNIAAWQQIATSADDLAQYQ
jgi:hypothetical protein